MSSPDCYGEHGNHLCGGCVHEDGCKHITMHLNQTQKLIDHLTSYNETIAAKDAENLRIMSELKDLRESYQCMERYTPCESQEFIEKLDKIIGREWAFIGHNDGCGYCRHEEQAIKEGWCEHGAKHRFRQCGVAVNGSRKCTTCNSKGLNQCLECDDGDMWNFV